MCPGLSVPLAEVVVAPDHEDPVANLIYIIIIIIIIIIIMMMVIIGFLLFILFYD